MGQRLMKFPSPGKNRNKSSSGETTYTEVSKGCGRIPISGGGIILKKETGQTKQQLGAQAQGQPEEITWGGKGTGERVGGNGTGGTGLTSLKTKRNNASIGGGQGVKSWRV